MLFILFQSLIPSLGGEPCASAAISEDWRGRAGGTRDTGVSRPGDTRVRRRRWAGLPTHIHTQLPLAEHIVVSPTGARGALPATLAREAGAKLQRAGEGDQGSGRHTAQGQGGTGNCRASVLPVQPLPMPRDSITFRCGPLNKINLPGQEASFQEPNLNQRTSHSQKGTCLSLNPIRFWWSREMEAGEQRLPS